MKTKSVSFISLIALLTALCLLGGCGQSAASADPVTTVADIATTQSFTDEAVKSSDIDTIVMAGVNAPSAMNGQPWHFSVITDAAVLQQISESTGFGGGMPRNGGEMPEGMELPEGEMPEIAEQFPDGEMPEGMEFPEGMEMPEGMERPEGMPEGMEFPEGMERPEGMPEGMEFPEGMEMPEGQMPEGFGGAGGNQSKAGLTDAPLVIVISCKESSELDAGLACQNMSAAAQLLGYGTKIISSPTMAVNGENQQEYRELLGIPEDQSAVAFLLVGVADTENDSTTGATTRNSVDEMVTYVKG